MFVLFLCNLYRLLYTIFKYYASPRLKKIYRCDITATVSLMSYLGIFCKFSRGLFYIYTHACVFAGGGATKSLRLCQSGKKESFSYGKNYKVLCKSVRFSLTVTF